MLISLLGSDCIVVPVFRSWPKVSISRGRDYASVIHWAHQCRPIWSSKFLLPTPGIELRSSSVASERLATQPARAPLNVLYNHWACYFYYLSERESCLADEAKCTNVCLLSLIKVFLIYCSSLYGLMTEFIWTFCVLHTTLFFPVLLSFAYLLNSDLCELNS